MLVLSILGALAAKPNQVVEPIKSDVYEYFDIEFSNLKNEKGEIYKIFQAVPKVVKTYKKVLFMTDGNAQFPMLLNLYKSCKEPPLIIAVGYDTNLAYDRKRRTKDYTPKANPEEFKDGGGADEFYKFIKDTLIPFTDLKFNTKYSSKSLYGHSFGGLFALFALLANDEIFDNFFIASPSLWWGDSEILKQAVAEGKFKKKIKVGFVSLSVGELEKRAGKTDRKDALKIADLAEILKNSEISYKFKIYQVKTHGSVIPFVLQDVLSYLCD
ncbi:MAG: alpha/beta hydrolase [Campylobacter sp.]|nr:alpha/beta hydrolase [Campylobacter sp.]